MIVLDTCVVSELLRRKPDPGVRSWAAALNEPAALTSVTVWELCYGIDRMVRGRRRTELSDAVEQVLRDTRGGILAFDEAAARCAARMRVSRERAGRPVATADVQIAGICEAHGAALATRNVKDFAALGLELIDPWVADSTE